MTHLSNQGYRNWRTLPLGSIVILNWKYLRSIFKNILLTFSVIFTHLVFGQFYAGFFSFFYNFICIQWISLVKNPLSVFPIACVSLRKEIIYATKKKKKIYVATKCKATSKVPKQFLYFFYDPEKTFTVVYLFWCRFKWNVSVIITLQFCFIRLDWRSMT